MDDRVRSAIGGALGRPVASARQLGGGCIGEVYAVSLEGGGAAVAKVDGGAAPRLDVEAYMLRYLREHSELPVPAVLHGSPGLLVMEFVPGDSQFNARSEVHAAELLSALHGIRGARHGLERATLIGGLRQPNPETGSWIAFFREHRLLYMAREAHSAGIMPARTLGCIERFAADLDRYLEEPEYPALLHGDVWTTNVLASDGRITGFLDPAVYYGHPEIELAFITLFNTFGSAFFEAYDGLRGIQAGFFEVRRDIYNLYPLLVHTRLFGAGYLGGVERTLSRLGYIA